MPLIQPLNQTGAIQTNGHDCGVWTLSYIASALRGFDLPGITERDIVVMRRFLFAVVMSIASPGR